MRSLLRLYVHRICPNADDDGTRMVRAYFRLRSWIRVVDDNAIDAVILPHRRHWRPDHATWRVRLCIGYCLEGILVGELEPVAVGAAPVDEGLVAEPTLGAPFRIRSGYFWYYAAVGAFAPFVSLYYHDLGMTGLQLGVLMALPALWTAFTGAIWGSVADSLAIHRLLLRIAIVAAAAIALVATQPTTFATLLVLMSVLAFTLVPIPPLLDSYAVNIAERTNHAYGSLRVWGSIGFTVMVLVMGPLLGDRVTSKFLLFYAACLIVAWLSIFGLPQLSERRPRPLFDGLQAVKQSKPFLLILLVAYLLATGYAVLSSFMGIHIQELGGSTGQVGLAYALSAVTEFPVLMFSGWILTRFGARRMMVIAICFYIVRFGLLSFAPSPEWVIGAQVFHGLSFGLFLIASVTLAHRLVGRDNAATGQAVLGTVSFGFGSITGSLTGGALLDAVGTFAIFRGVTLVMFLTLIIFVIGNQRNSIEGNDPVAPEATG